MSGSKAGVVVHSIEQLSQALEILIEFREKHGWPPDRYEPQEPEADDDEWPDDEKGGESA